MALDTRVLASNEASVSSGTSVSVTPTGMQVDDWLVFLLVSVGGTATHSNTGGSCTRVHDDFTQGNVTVVSSWKKKCGAGEAGPYTFSIGATARRITLAVRCYSGGDLTDIVGQAQAFIGISAQQLDLASVTPAGAGRWHLLFEGSASAGGGFVNFGQPVNYAEKHDFASAHASNQNSCLGWAERVLPDASPTGVKTFTISGGVNRQMVGGQLLLKPSATGSPNPDTPTGLRISTVFPVLETQTIQELGGPAVLRLGDSVETVVAPATGYVAVVDLPDELRLDGYPPNVAAVVKVADAPDGLRLNGAVDSAGVVSSWPASLGGTATPDLLGGTVEVK